MEKLIQVQQEDGVKLKKDYEKIEKEYKEQISNLEKSKQKFLNAYSNAEAAAKDYELNKISPLSNNMEKSQIKCISTLKEAKEAEKAYLTQLTNTNNIRGQYIEENKRILCLLESLDYSFAMICKESFQKYIVYSNAYITNQNFDLDKLKQSISMINIDYDMQSFIDNNQVKLEYPPKHEYCEYQIKLKENPCYEYHYPPEVVLKIIDTVNSNFEMKVHEWDFNEEMNKLRINDMIKKVFNDDDISDDERKMITHLLHSRTYRSYFLNHLNSYRIKGLFQIKEKNFEIIGEILKKILNSQEIKDNSNSNSSNNNNNEYENLMLADKDYFEECKYVIILSQTFKCKNDSLQVKIEKDPVLQKREFWENMIQSKTKLNYHFILTYYFSSYS